MDMIWFTEAQGAFNTSEGAVFGVVCVFIGAYLVRSALFALVMRTIPPRVDLPTVPRPDGHDFRETMRQGMIKYPNKAWVIPFEEPTVILPHSSLDSQVKKIPEPDLTLNGNMYRRFFGAYTQVGTDDAELVDALRVDLTRNVHGLLSEMAEEVAHGFNSVVGSPVDWVPFATYSTMLRIVALTSGRIFVGLPLCREEAWIEASIQHTIGSVRFSDKLRSYMPWLRPLVAPFLSEMKEMQSFQKTISSQLEPIIAQHLRIHNQAHGAVPVGRMTGWLLGQYDKRSCQPKPRRLVRDHLTLSFAAIHVASMALSHILHDLAARPEYMGMLRSELEAELQNCEGNLDSKALASLVKMDSFVKESLRLNPAGTVAWTRLATVPIRLNNGEVIPKNSMVAFCNPRFNPNLDDLENPEDFDGLRYVKLAQIHGPQTRYKLDSLSVDSLGFGYGQHACPGRSFAVAELKLVVAHLITHYDLMLQHGEGRPENIYMDFQIMPNPEARILLRRRSKASQ